MTTLWTKRRANTNVIPYAWTTVDRPTDLVDGLTGYNTTLQGIESYNYQTSKWHIFSGSWTVDTRPDSSVIDVGSQGYNTELGCIEMWNGSSWLAL